MRERLKKLFEFEAHPISLKPEEAKLVSGSSFQQITFSTTSGEEIRAFYTTPKGTGPAPAILYIHAHGGRYDIGADELLNGRPALKGPLGQVFYDMGYAVLCIDLPGFGDRADKSESALAKEALWYGKSLAGQMMGELKSAFDWLSAQNGVDPSKIGVFGISMGATFGYWLAAVEPRIAAVAHLCCFADFEELIKTGAHDLHGIYLTVPGLLNVASNSEIASQVAPRPQFVGIGDQDPLTPPQAIDLALDKLRAAYENSLNHLTIHRESHVGHEETPQMRKAVLKFFKLKLG
ncbi:MAG: prolyl oligopeptidase family serine peptidase [Rhodobacteraceae bacterium]|nr:prolyl oligopeptidase family serine peptidase [Paracoccaceae bacterium]